MIVYKVGGLTFAVIAETARGPVMENSDEAEAPNPVMKPAYLQDKANTVINLSINILKHFTDKLKKHFFNICPLLSLGRKNGKGTFGVCC